MWWQVLCITLKLKCEHYLLYNTVITHFILLYNTVITRYFILLYNTVFTHLFYIVIIIGLCVFYVVYSYACTIYQSNDSLLHRFCLFVQNFHFGSGGAVVVLLWPGCVSCFFVLLVVV